MNRNYVIDEPSRYESKVASYIRGDKKSDYPYTLVFVKKQFDFHYYYGYPIGYGGQGTGQLLTVPSSVMANIQINNILKVTDKLKGNDFNASVFLGEGKQTIQMLSKNINSLATSVVNLRRGNIMGAARSLGFVPTPKLQTKLKKSWDRDKARGVLKNTALGVSDSWLELQFGWKPLLSDIKSGAEAIGALDFPPRTMSASSSNRRAGATAETSGYSDQKVYQTGDVIWDTRINYQCGIKLTLGAPHSDIGTLGLDNPYTMLWNITPWSFLVDYVIPIGDYINAKEAINKLDVVSYVKWEKTHQHMHGSWDPAASPIITGTQSDYQWLTFTRQLLPPNSAKDVPLPGVKEVKSIFSTSHVLNSIALLTQAFR